MLEGTFLKKLYIYLKVVKLDSYMKQQISKRRSQIRYFIRQKYFYDHAA